MIHIPAQLLNEMQVVVGSPNEINTQAEEPFSQVRVDFLGELSRALLNDPHVRKLPDVTTFAFWCRQNRLERLAGRWNRTNLRLGLGLCFHLSPANVPVNFAFSLAFGLLSGNSNVIRLSSRYSESTEKILEKVSHLLDEKRFVKLKRDIVLIKYGHSDPITQFWLDHAMCHIIWGGDSTVTHIRNMRKHPRSREIAFADRVSACVIRAEAILTMNDAEIVSLCARLYNDIYLMDQRACSSPQLIIWVGESNHIENSMERLWKVFTKLAAENYSIQPIQVIDKFVDVCSQAIESEDIVQVLVESPVLTRIRLKHLSPDIWKHRPFYGTIQEYEARDLDEINPILSKKFQTLTQFGYSTEELRAFIVRTRPEGVDRIVQVGRAIEMDFIWDGFDVLSSLTRIIDIS